MLMAMTMSAGMTKAHAAPSLHEIQHDDPVSYCDQRMPAEMATMMPGICKARVTKHQSRNPKTDDVADKVD